MTASKRARQWFRFLCVVGAIAVALTVGGWMFVLGVTGVSSSTPRTDAILAEVPAIQCQEYPRGMNNYPHHSVRCISQSPGHWFFFEQGVQQGAYSGLGFEGWLALPTDPGPVIIVRLYLLEGPIIEREVSINANYLRQGQEGNL